MATLTALGAAHGFTADDLDTSGQVAMQPAYQKIYFADGRASSATIADSGYHKIDLLNTRLVGAASGAFTKGEVVTQATSGATGIYDELVTRAGPIYWHMVYRTDTTQFDATNEITGADSGETLTPSAVAVPPHWLNWELTAGTFPDGGSNIASLCWGRVFLNSIQNPHQWFSTRINDPLDLLLVVDDVAAPQNSQTATKAGLVGDQLIAMIPYKGNMQVFGCLNHMFVMRADPAKGGLFTTLSDATGIFSATSSCWDDKDNLFFVGSDGVYVLSADDIINGRAPTNVTKEQVPKLMEDMGLNRRTDRLVMAYDKNKYGIQISAVQMDGAWKSIFWLELKTGGVFPDNYNASHLQTSLYFHNARRKDDRRLLAGCQDGYVRTWDDDEKSDDSVAISSHVLLGPIVSDDVRTNVNLSELSVQPGINTDSLTVSIFAEKTAAKVTANETNGVAPNKVRTYTGGGLKPSMRQVANNGSVGVKLSNTTTDSSWSIEEVNADIKGSGRTI